MHTEFELKFLGEDLQLLKETIVTQGGVLTKPKTLMRRLIFDLPGEGEFIRVRDEGDLITMTFKSMKSKLIDGTKEIDIVVSEFDAAVAILQSGGLKAGSYQESYRTNYLLYGCEICFDRWPGISEYVEIEGPTQQSVEDCIIKLGLDITQGFGGTVSSIYEQELGFKPGDLQTIAELTFANPPQSKF